MPKRKRMSFTASKKRKSLTPAKRSSKEGPRPRARPKARLADTQREIVEEEDDDDNDSDNDNGVDDVDADDSGMIDEEKQNIPPKPKSSSQARKDLEDNIDEEQGGEEGSDDDEEQGADLSYPRLSAETVYVRKETISKKWEHLDYASQGAVTQIFADVARLVIASQLGEKAGRDAEDSEGKSAEAQKAVEGVFATLTQRLHRMPIPPKSSADAFNYEKLMRETALAESQLSEHTAGIAVLRAEIKKSETEKARMNEEVTELKKEVEKSEADIEKRLQGKFGKLLRLPDVEPEDSARRIRLAPRSDAKSVFDSDAEVGPEVRELMDQLGQHVASMHANRMQTANLETELDNANAITNGRNRGTLSTSSSGAG